MRKIDKQRLIMAIVISWVLVAAGTWYIATLPEDNEDDGAVTSEALGAGIGVYTGGVNLSSASMPYDGIDFEFTYSAGELASPLYVLVGGSVSIRALDPTDGSAYVGVQQITPGFGLIRENNMNVTGTLTHAATVTMIIETDEMMIYEKQIIGVNVLTFSEMQTINIVGGQTASFTPHTNITSNISLTSAPSWVTMSGGAVTVNAPVVSEDQLFQITLTAEIGSQTAQQGVTVRVVPELAVTSPDPSGDAPLGNMWSYSPTANLAGVTWSVSGLPSWLSWNPGNQMIIGTIPGYLPLGPYNFTVTAATQNPIQTATQIVTINAVAHVWSMPPSGAIYIEEIKGVPLMYRFSIIGNEIESILWDFGDGTITDDWSPVHIFADYGEYTITAEISNPLDTVTVTATLTIKAPPTEDRSASIWQAWYVYAFGIALGIAILMWMGKKLSKGRR